MSRLLLIILAGVGIGLALSQLQLGMRAKVDEQISGHLMRTNYIQAGANSSPTKSNSAASSASAAASSASAAATTADATSNAEAKVASLDEPKSAPGSTPVESSAVESTPVESSPVETAGPPRIELPEGKIHQFGTMKFNSRLSHEFPIRNVGGTPLRIEKGDSTCKCTVGELDDEFILPGQETKIRLEWHGNSVTQEFKQAASFKTNDVAMPEFRLEIHGAVIGNFAIDPEVLQLGSFASEAGISRDFKVACFENGVDLNHVEWSEGTSSNHIKLTQTPISLDQMPNYPNSVKAYNVRLEILPGMPNGPIYGKISLHTKEDSDSDRLTVHVQGNVVSELTLFGGSNLDIQKNHLTIGDVSASKGGSTKIWLVVRGSDHQETELEIEQSQATDSLKVSVGEKKVEANRTVIPIIFDIPQNAPEAYFPGPSRSLMLPITFHAKSSNRNLQLPIYVKLIVGK